MDVSDLLTFAQLGRVKFFEAHQFIVTQGATRFDVFVIQQGTVLLWDERSAEARLLDVRGAGAMLGIEGFNQARYLSVLRQVRQRCVDLFLSGEGIRCSCRKVS